MTRVVPIVEGHGEVSAVPILLRRLWSEQWDRGFIDVLRPIRRPGGQLVKRKQLLRAVDLAALKLAAFSEPSRSSLILLLLDADRDAVCRLAPELSQRVRSARPHLSFSCVLANVEFETWFVVGAAMDLALARTNSPSFDKLCRELERLPGAIA